MPPGARVAEGEPFGPTARETWRAGALRLAARLACARNGRRGSAIVTSAHKRFPQRTDDEAPWGTSTPRHLPSGHAERRSAMDRSPASAVSVDRRSYCRRSPPIRRAPTRRGTRRRLTALRLRDRAKRFASAACRRGSSPAVATSATGREIASHERVRRASGYATREEVREDSGERRALRSALRVEVGTERSQRRLSPTRRAAAS